MYSLYKSINMKTVLLFKEACCALVATRLNLVHQYANHPFIVFGTLSPNPAVKVDSHAYTSRGNQRNCKQQFKDLTPERQLEYCMKVLNGYTKYLIDPTILGTWELNKSGNCHLHYLLISDDIKDDYGLWEFRKNLLTDHEVRRNFKKKDYMNNIVELDEKTFEEILEYFDKDHDKKVNKHYHFNYLIYNK